ncbi:MAG: sulfotransferase family protein, partial [Parvibaculales bacterium]
SFFFPKNMSYFSKYTLLKTSRQNIEKWKKIYSKMLKEIALYSGKHKKIILKNPHNTARVKILKEMYPGAKFIFIHRNPYDVFSSTKHLHMTLIKEQYMQAFSEHEINELVLHCYEQMMQGYLEQRKLIGIDNLIEISYSDLNENPMKCMEKVYKKLNLKNYQGVKKYFEDYLLSQQTYRKNAFTPLSAELKANIKRRWAFAFKAWDYESS